MTSGTQAHTGYSFLSHVFKQLRCIFTLLVLVSAGMKHKDIYIIFPYIFLASYSLIITLVILYLNNGHFTYGLDDAYISLGLARNIFHGHYGLQMEEFSAPSSSIIWPFILASFAKLPFFVYVPMIINIILCFVGLRILQLVFASSFKSRTGEFRLYMAVALCCLVVGLNFVGTATEGLEHSLQIIVSLVCAYGLIRFYKDKKIHTWLILAMIIGPAVRYEMAAITLICCAVLFYEKRFVASMLCGLASLIIPVVFSLFLLSNGAGYLPSSVLIKMFLQKHLSVFVISNMVQDIGMVMTLFLALAVASFYKIKNKKYYPLLLAAFAVFIIHIIFGSNLMWRYTTYCFAFAIPLLVFVNAKHIETYFSDGQVNRNCVRIIIGILCCMFPLTSAALFYSPVKCRDIYLQQGQMLNFVNKYYPHPVGVNDVGYMSLYHDQYVLDYVGLSNEKVRKFVLLEDRSLGNGWMGAITKDYNVGLAILYSNWFGGLIPKSWTKVASLRISDDIQSFKYLDLDEIDFYATRPSEVGVLLPKFRKFAKELPESVEFKILLDIN